MRDMERVLFEIREGPLQGEIDDLSLAPAERFDLKLALLYRDLDTFFHQAIPPEMEDRVNDVMDGVQEVRAAFREVVEHLEART